MDFKNIPNLDFDDVPNVDLDVMPTEKFDDMPNEMPNENFHGVLRFTLEHLLESTPSSDFEMWLSGKIQWTTNLYCCLKHKLKAAIDVYPYLYIKKISFG